MGYWQYINGGGWIVNLLLGMGLSLLQNEQRASTRTQVYPSRLLQCLLKHESDKSMGSIYDRTIACVPVRFHETSSLSHAGLFFSGVPWS